MLSRLKILSLVVLTILISSPAWAATITVNTNVDEPVGNAGTCSLRQAIQAANLDSAVGNCTSGDNGLDEIVFADPNQTFTLTIDPTGDPNDNQSGDLDICTPISIMGAGPENTIIRAGFAVATPDRVLHIVGLAQNGSCLSIGAGTSGQGGPGDPALNLAGVSVENGNTVTPINMANANLIAGGGILNMNTLILMNVVVQNNSASNPNNANGQESALVRGGGVFNGGLAAVEMSTIRDNMVSSLGSSNDPDARGAGIANMQAEAILQETECTGLIMSTTKVQDNTVNRGSGGGISVENCTAVVGLSAIFNNLVLGEISTGPDCGIDHLGNGGGVSILGDDGNASAELVALADVTISGNQAPRDGGGIHQCNEEMQPTEVSSVTIANNQATGSGGGAWNSGEGVDNQFQFQNTIIADNSASVGPDCTQEDPTEYLTSFGFNLVRDPTDCIILDSAAMPPSDDLPAGSDPMLGPLADNGGKTLTHALQLGSAAIDMANPSECSALISSSVPLDFDQRDDPFNRIEPGVIGGTPRCDVGAFEFTPTEITTDKTASGDAQVGEEFDYTITVTNQGPGVATGVMLSDPLPAEVSFVNFVNISQGTCNHNGGVVDCDLGVIQPNNTATVVIRVVAIAAGTTVNMATVTTNETEPQTPEVTTQITGNTNFLIEGSGLLPCSLQRGPVPAHTPYVLAVILGSLLLALLGVRKRSQQGS